MFDKGTPFPIKLSLEYLKGVQITSRIRVKHSKLKLTVTTIVTSANRTLMSHYYDSKLHKCNQSTIKMIRIINLFGIFMKITIFSRFFEVRNEKIVRTPIDCGFLNYANAHFRSFGLNRSRVVDLRDS